MLEIHLFERREQPGRSLVGLVQAFDANDRIAHQNNLIGGLLPELVDLSVACCFANHDLVACLEFSAGDFGIAVVGDAELSH